MRLETLKQRLPPGFDVDSRYREFRAQDTGVVAGEAERFLSWLRERDLVDGSLFVELHGAGAIDLSRLVAVRPDRTLVFADAGDLTLTAEARDAAVAAVPAAKPGPAGARFQMLGRLGAGAMGEVHIARDIDLRRKVALKRMVPAVAQSQALAARFFAEIQVTAQLDHPNIVPIYNLEVAPDGTLAYSMKLVQGRTLSAILDDARAALARDGRKRERERLAQRLDIFLRVCDAMAYAHHKGVLHRDLKPENIMVGRYNEVYVMDWGICRVIGGADDDAASAVAGDDTSRTQYGALLGTPTYMSPEQALGKNPELDGRSDQFALGLILQELVTLAPARRPGELMALLALAAEGRRQPLAHVDPRVRVAPELRAIVAKACAPAPDLRYATVAALADDVRRFLAGEPVHARRDTPLERIARFVGRHRVGVALAMLLLMLCGAAAVIALLWHEQRALTEARRHERALQRLLSQVSSQAHEVDNQFFEYESEVEALAGRAAELLSRGAPPASRVYFAADFDAPARAPADVAASPRYARPVSFAEPVFQLAPGVAPADVAADVRRLLLLRPALRQTMIASAVGDSAELTPAMATTLLASPHLPLARVYVTLENGVHLTYPGQGGFPSTYDGRKRPKYVLAAHKLGMRWGNPYVDPLGGGPILPGSTAIYDDDGRFLGVAGAGVTFEWILDRLLVLRDARAVERTYLVDEEGRVVVHSGEGAREIAANSSSEDGAVRLAPLPWPDVADAARAHRSGHVERDGRVVAWQPLAALNWTYVVEARVATLPAD